MNSSSPLKSVSARIADELSVGESQVAAAVKLLDEGSTVPFIARYRKEVTGSLDDAQLRTLEDRLGYLRELDDRRAAVIASIEEQGKLTDELRAALLAAETKSRVEDIYLPYKQKRRTKAQIARENGLAPLAEQLLGDPDQTPEDVAARFITDTVTDAAAALDGARHILVEQAAENAELVGGVRERFWSQAAVSTGLREGADPQKAQKFRDYFEFSGPLEQMPSHRVLAVLRGEKEEVLSLTFDGGDDADYEAMVAATLGWRNEGRAADKWLGTVVRWAWRTKLMVSATVDARTRLRQRAEDDAVAVFATNLKDLLLAAPAGARPTLGLDPGFRNGVKTAVVDATGKVLETLIIYPHQPQNQWDKSKAALAALIARHDVELVAIGNGTASRETDALTTELVAEIRKAGGKAPAKAVVSEAGASIYSASEYASAELPDMDVSLRGAVSIARRLQDPLAELVKIDPKSIGVGQYQHDVSQSSLAKSLDAVVEDAVNAVGVDLNTASAPLLARVSGISDTLAGLIVAHRDQSGAFRSRKALLDVPRLGPKAFEQCAGFLRIREGDDPLDASGVHPEAYPVVRHILERSGLQLAELIGNSAALSKLRPADVAADLDDERFGVPTVTDILAELDKPGRDPRPAFATATFAAGVEKVSDLTPGMVLEGVVTNVAAFGAFIDVGVHQDGLVHVSAMSDRYVSDPHEVVRSGQVVKVKVVDVDVERQRIGLSLRLNDDASGKDARGQRGGGQRGGGQRGGDPRDRNRVPQNGQGGHRRGDSRGGNGKSGGRGQSGRNQSPASGSMADALRKAGFGK